MSVACLFVIFLSLCVTCATAGEPTILTAQHIVLQTIETSPTSIPARLFVPPNQTNMGAIVFAHGSGGLYKNDDPQDVINENFRKWANQAALHDPPYISLFFDSYTPRGGKQGADAVMTRPYDSLAALQHLTESASLAGLVDASNVHLVGWSHGGTTALSTSANASSARAQWVSAGHSGDYASAAAFYPGCGMDSAYGGVSKSLWCPRQDVLVLAASLDPLYSGGNCDTRVLRSAAIQCSSAARLLVYQQAAHGFDQAETADVPVKYSQADLDAMLAGDVAVWAWIEARRQGATPLPGYPTTAPPSASASASEACLGVLFALLVASLYID